MWVRVTKKVNLVLQVVAWAQALGRAMEVLRRVFHRVDVDACSSLRVVATLGETFLVRDVMVPMDLVQSLKTKQAPDSSSR